ncbi:hypothetical protein ACVW04_005391 [Bradyrhizobium sp. LM2.3]
MCPSPSSGWKSDETCSMLASKPRQEGPSSQSIRVGNHEKKRLHQGNRAWCGGCRDARGSSHRAIDARDQMAHADELAEITRYALWRRRDDGQDGRGSDRQQIPDSDICRRRDRAGPSGARCRAERNLRNRPHRVLLLFRQGPDLHLRLGRAVRTEHAHQPGLVHAGRRQGRPERVLQEVQRRFAALPATPAVRWVAGSARRSRRLRTSAG